MSRPDVFIVLRVVSFADAERQLADAGNDQAGVWAAEGKRAWLTYLEAKRWLVAHGWTLGGEPAEVFRVNVPTKPCPQVCFRLAVAGRVTRCEQHAVRAVMMADVEVVQAAQALAKSLDRPYAFGRRAAIHVLTKCAPFAPSDLAASLRMRLHIGLTPDDIETIDRATLRQPTPRA